MSAAVKTLVNFRSDFLDEMEAVPASPVVFTNTTLLDRWAIGAFDDVDQMAPARVVNDQAASPITNRYEAPPDLIWIDRTTYVVVDVNGVEAESPLDGRFDLETGHVYVSGFFGPPGVIRLRYRARHNRATQSVASTTLRADQEPAILELMFERAERWIARQLVAGNGSGVAGVLSFKRGEYSEDGGKALDALMTSADAHRANALRILGGNAPAMAEVGGCEYTPTPPGSYR